MEEKPSLLGSSSDSDVEFEINEDYAKSYDTWREKEEMQKLKDKYGDVSTLSSSSESEEYKPPKVKESFYKALSLVKSGDSKMYEINNTDDSDSDSEVEPKISKEKKTKPMYLKDYERKVALETGGQFSDYEDEHVPEKKLSYDEEQEQIKKSFKSIDLSDDDDNSSDILNVRATTKDEQEKLDADYVAYLKGDMKLEKEARDEKKDLTFLRNYWNDPKLHEDEKFLRDYFLNAEYKEEDESGTIPTYEDITNDVGESEEEAAAEFEHKYNFRFEEPDSEFIKRYPRTMKDTLRRSDERRKTKRQEHAERKKLEKLQRREEIKQLKALKRKEIEERLKLLKQTLHDENIAFEYADVEGDFDPEEHDRKMSKLFSNQYYDVPEEEKPSFPEDEDLDFEDWDNWTGDNEDDAENNGKTNEESQHCEDPSFNKDGGSEDPKLAFQKEMIEASKPCSRKKKKSYFASAISKNKPVFDPSDKSFEQYLNEYYQLDCEDFIGDLPTRFRYKEVVPNDFGLSVNEILTAEDRELNQWCSLKRVCQNRTKDEEIYDVQAYKKKAENELKKKKIFATLFDESEHDNTEKKTKKQKKAEKLNESTSDTLENEVSNKAATTSSAEQDNDNTKKKTKKQKKAKKLNESTGDTLENEISNKAATTSSAEQDNDDNQDCAPNTDQGIKKKKKKKKKNKNVNGNESVSGPCTETSQDPEALSSLTQNSTVDIPSKKRKYVEETGNTQENDSLNASGQSHKKKKRKYNKEETSQFTKSHKGKKDRHKQAEVADKRLLLSDKRLEAYGINPKKFKNKIRFSNK